MRHLPEVVAHGIYLHPKWPSGSCHWSGFSFLVATVVLHLFKLQKETHIFPNMKWTAIFCYLTDRSCGSVCGSASEAVFDLHILRKFPQCFYLCTYLFHYLLAKANNPNLSALCPSASLGIPRQFPLLPEYFLMTVPSLLSSISSFLLPVAIFCHTLLITSQVPMTISSSAATQVEIARLKLKNTLPFVVRQVVPSPPEDKCQYAYCYSGFTLKWLWSYMKWCYIFIDYRKEKKAYLARDLVYSSSTVLLDSIAVPLLKVAKI